MRALTGPGGRKGGYVTLVEVWLSGGRQVGKGRVLASWDWAQYSVPLSQGFEGFFSSDLLFFFVQVTRTSSRVTPATLVTLTCSLFRSRASRSVCSIKVVRLKSRPLESLGLELGS